MTFRPLPTPERIQEALNDPSWSKVTGTGLDALERLLDHVPSDVRRMVSYADMDVDPIVPIWRSLARMEMDGFDILGLCYGLTHESIRSIHDRAIAKLRRHPGIGQLAETAALLRHATDNRLETDYSDV